MATKKPVLLAILDGVAIRDEEKGNAFKQAHPENFLRYMKEYPHTTLSASGEAVGLPKGQMGNSEVGHLNIGAGRVVYQSLVLVNKAIEEETYFNNETLLSAVEHAKKNNSKLHIMGLLSDGGVHSHIEHLLATVELAKRNGLENVFIHAFLDGRDVGPKTALTYVEQTEAKLAELGVGKIATVSGRYYAMDRDKRWDRVELAYNAMINGFGPKATSAKEAIESSYKEDTLDEFVLPTVIEENGMIKDNDAVIFVNFRPDRAIQIASVITNETYGDFDVLNRPQNLKFVCMMKYADTVIGDIAYKPVSLDNVFGDYLSEKGFTQLRIAETEKYAHVTFFFDGGVDKEIKGATRVLVNSPKVATYDLQPEMSAPEVTKALLAELDKDIHDVIILNYANCDMVGHTGDMTATIKAVRAVDEGLGQVVDKVISLGGVALITADHGNSEMLEDAEGNTVTAHTTNPVPLIVTKKDINLLDGGKLGDLAPTMLDLLGVEKPAEMTGISLLK